MSLLLDAMNYMEPPLELAEMPTPVADEPPSASDDGDGPAFAEAATYVELPELPGPVFALPIHAQWSARTLYLAPHAQEGRLGRVIVCASAALALLATITLYLHQYRAAAQFGESLLRLPAAASAQPATRAGE